MRAGRYVPIAPRSWNCSTSSASRPWRRGTRPGDLVELRASERASLSLRVRGSKPSKLRSVPEFHRGSRAGPGRGALFTSARRSGHEPRRRTTLPHRHRHPPPANETTDIYPRRHRRYDRRRLARGLESRSHRQWWCSRKRPTGRVLLNLRHRAGDRPGLGLLPLVAAVAEKMI